MLALLHRPRNQSDRIVFNGNDLSHIVYCKVRRPIMATVNPVFETVPGRDGEVFRRVTRGGFDLPVDMWIRAEDRREVAEVRHELAAALWSDAPAPLYLPDDPARYHLAIVTGDTDLDEITDDCPTTTVTFRVGDPDSFGRSRRMDVSAGSVFLDAGGTRPTYLRVTAKPAAGTSWRISNLDTGEFVQIGQAIASGSTVRLDMESERATLNGQLAAMTIDSDCFAIEGRTHLSISSGTATLEWVERWL